MKLLFKDCCSIQKGSICILGLPSLGNVGQIATDDVLSVMSEKGRAIRIGAIESPLLLPMTGYYELQGRQQLCLPVEVWRIEDSNIVVVLQRSLCIPGAQRLFYKQLIELLDAEMKCSLTVVLTGASTESLEPSMRRSMFSIACSTDAKTKLVSTFPAIASSLESTFALNTVLPSAVQSIELATAETALSSDSSMTRAGNLYSFEDEQEEEGGLTCTGAVQRALSATLPRGMTAAKYLLEHQQLRSRPTTSSSSADMGVVVLGKLCAEGDNFPDGRQLAAEVVRCIV